MYISNQVPTSSYVPVLARVTTFLAQTILGNVSQQSIVQLGLSFNDYICHTKKKQPYQKPFDPPNSAKKWVSLVEGC